jgi:prepilin-type N-terminal cleavage/methylation domain-containing protein
MNNGRPGKQGFSLVEVMCAIVILGVALAGLTQGVTTALTSTKESENQTNAALIAAGVIEALRAEDELIDGTTDGVCEEGLSKYRWKQTVSKTELDGLHQVEVVVENSKSGQTIYELQTMLFEVPQESTTSDSTKRKDAARKKEGRRQ